MTFVPAPWTWPRAVSSVLLEAPTEEPITLAQAKLAAGLDWADGDVRDEQMRGFIRAARQQVEFRTGLALLTQTRQVTLCAPAGAMVPMPWQALPVQSITPIDPAEVAPLVDTARRSLLVPTPRIWNGDGVGYPYQVPLVYRVVAGWPDAATLAAEAPLLVHAVSLLTAHMATVGRDLVVLETRMEIVPQGFEEAIAPYCQVWVP